MQVMDIVSFSLFVIFIVSYMMKLIHLARKKGISAHVLGKQGKPTRIHFVEMTVKICSASWAVVWCIYSLGIGRMLLKPLLSGTFAWAGIAVTGAGLYLFITAMVYMSNSWRVGIDQKSETSLVTGGIYRYSRNPAFVGFDFMFIGFMLMYPTVINIAIGIINLISFHLLIIQEEKHLEQTFGELYRKYSKRTPRYLWFI